MPVSPFPSLRIECQASLVPPGPRATLPPHVIQAPQGFLLSLKALATPFHLRPGQVPRPAVLCPCPQSTVWFLAKSAPFFPCHCPVPSLLCYFFLALSTPILSFYLLSALFSVSLLGCELSGGRDFAWSTAVVAPGSSTQEELVKYVWSDE